jgi:vitamin B12 transporter
MALTLFLVVLGIAFRLAPHAPGAVPLGAIALFSGARLPRSRAAAVPILVLALSDVFLGWDAPHVAVRFAVYGTLATAAIAGARLKRASALRLGGFAAATSAAFYLTTNFAMWAAEGYYPQTLEGLARCYAAAIPALLRGLAADLAGVALLFGLDALRSRASARRAAAASAIAVTVLFAAASARAQAPAPVSEDVVVSASLAPEEEPSVSASVTVIAREQIQKSGKTDVLELLREVPGLDVVQSGGAGSTTSVFIRGATSSQTLVLVDGVRVNDPFGTGYDFSSLSTQNVERIEVVRGPFSALYGADAVGGVISILTRAAAATPTGRFTAGGGTRGFHEETLFATGGEGPFALSVSGRDVHDGGDPQNVAGVSVDNAAWHSRNGSAAFAWTPGESFHAALTVDRTFARTEIPSDGAQATPRRTATFDQTLWELPVRARFSETNVLTGSLSDVEFHPGSADPDDTTGFAQTDTRARTRGARVADSWTISSDNTLSGTASYERSNVDSRGSFGPIVEDRHTAIWGVGAEDQWTFAGGRLRAVAGIRYDRHSQFGSATDPRASLVWDLDPRDALRVSYGQAFRAPSIADLYYPFFGNPDLKPERSKSYEIGFQRKAGALRLDAALFRTDFRDLIQFDQQSQLPGNVGRARTDGVEISASTAGAGPLSGRLAYTYLRAIDETTDTPLVRRPRHRASLEVGWTAPSWRADATAVWVGRRADIDSGPPYGSVEDPSYLRLDAHAEYRFGRVAPFLTLVNALDRRYAEADGYPARRRRVIGGLIASF